MEQLERCAMYYSKRTQDEKPPPGVDFFVAKEPIKHRRIMELEGSSNSSSLRTLSPTLNGHDSSFEFYPGKQIAELSPDSHPAELPSHAIKVSPAELPPESHPAELVDTSLQKRLSWPSHDEVLDFFVTDLKRRPQGRGATSSEEDEVVGTPIAELSLDDGFWQRTPTLTFNDETASQSTSQAVPNDIVTTSVGNALSPWIAEEEYVLENSVPLVTDNRDLYDSPSSYSARQPTLDYRSLTPEGSQRSARVSGTWSEQSNEWQDAQEWQSTDP